MVSFLTRPPKKTAKLSNSWGYGGQLIGNVAAYRATDSGDLLAAPDPVGPDNHEALLAMAKQAELIIVAHGNMPYGLEQTALQTHSLLRDAGHKLHVLKLLQTGMPGHPLYLLDNTQPRLWEPGSTAGS